MLGIRSDIIELIPAVQILFHKFSVKEDNRCIFLLSHVNNLRRCSPIHQIDAKHITGILQHFLYLLILHGLTSLRIETENIHLIAFSTLLRHFLVKGAHIAGDKGIMTVIQGDADFYFLLFPSLLTRFTGR